MESAQSAQSGLVWSQCSKSIYIGINAHVTDVTDGNVKIELEYAGFANIWHTRNIRDTQDIQSQLQRKIRHEQSKFYFEEVKRMLENVEAPMLAEQMDQAAPRVNCLKIFLLRPLCCIARYFYLSIFISFLKFQDIFLQPLCCNARCF